MPKIVFLDTATVADLPNELAKFHQLGTFTAYPSTLPEQTVERLRGADIAIVNKVVLGAAELEALPDLKLICVAATGMNNIDHEAAARRGIPVRNVSGYSTNAVAQLTLALLFTLSMDLLHLHQAVYDGTYAAQSAFAYWRQPFYELRGTRYGIIGMGAIGQRTAELATAYGAEVVYHSTSGRNTDQPYPAVALDELLQTCEVISIHCPLTDATRNLISYPQLQKMKPSAYLINVARGGIVHEADLVRALQEGLLAGAASDVFSTEPIPGDHPFMSLRDAGKLLLTPHIGWASVEARTTLLAGVRANCKL
ncbi:NAD(P)-dependent oxidoreductase [Neolewinella lacunae]|uniref:Hydroxyacid dehydrogenase n=1 Tax=Neolewinella lacunae TaxID=1517758 RepID=A0A923PKG8_9BACT|nr:NAD(P)-dependent oxidoreductase [Neolewinella lacunae]MBC6992868.1 hydroxyacid dehydrogenase [Neolewinella lacunae]MDN3633768.1 NAD(P)-dependent oxidoreductase [Neolewinella lacunae]